MTNQEAFEAARAGDWIAESFSRTGDVFTLGGKSAGYSSFADCLTDGQSIFYAAFDEDDNREAGLAIWDANARTLTPVEIHATLQAGKFTKGDPDPVPFKSGGTITGTFNATGFNTIWRHVFEKGNPHDTQADEIDQSNDKLGDTVQEALDRIAAYVIQLDPDGNTDIDWGDLDGLKDLLDSKAEQDDLEQEIQDRIDGDQALQDQIDALDPDGDRKVDWAEIEGKPTEFPPEAHNQGWDTITGKPADYPPSSHGHAWGEITGKPADFPPSAHDHAWSEITGKPAEFPPEDHGHEIADVNGLQDALDAAGGTPAWDDVTGKPTEFPPAAHNQDWSTIENTPSEYPPEAHTHEQSEVDGLELRLEAIENSITDGGGFVDAPDDGKLYGRQSEAWAEVVIPDAGASSWNDLTDKPAEFPPESHSHEIDDVNGLQDALDAAGGAPAWGDVTGKPTEFPPEAHQHGWDDVTGKPADYPPSAHGHAWDEITGKPTEFPPSAHDHDGVYQPVGDYIEDANSDGKQYARKDGAWSEVVIPDGGTGSSVHIGEAPPADPQEGQQWMEVPVSGDATMWIYDGDKWLQQPGGKDGADGVDGGIEEAPNDGLQYARQSEGWAEVKGGLWTDESDDVESVITYSGNVSIGGKYHTEHPDRDDTVVFESYAAGVRTWRVRTDGSTYQSGNVYCGGVGSTTATRAGIRFINDAIIVPTDNEQNSTTGICSLGRTSNKFKDLYLSGSVKMMTGVAIGSRDIIETLSTLRGATKDETTLEGLRDAIGNAVGELIDKFEAMQAEADNE